LRQGLQAARIDPPEPTESETSATADRPYRRALDKAIGQALDEANLLDRDRTAAGRLFEELIEHPQARRLTLVRNSRRFQTPALCELIISKGYDQRFSDVDLGVDLTGLAVVLSRQVTEDTCGLADTRDLEGRAWAFHGTALRVASDLRESERAFKEASRCFAEGLHTDQDKALLCRFKALLLRARRDFDGAQSLQDRAIEVYLRTGETRRAAFVMTDQALGVLYRGEPERAVPQLARALEIFTEIGEARGIAMVKHNLALSLIETGHPEDALEQVTEVRPLLQRLGDSLSSTRLRWLEGKILHELGYEQLAERALVEARDDFAAGWIGYDAALVCLDLAMLYARQGRSSDVRELAAQMLPIFRAQDVHQEALAALIIFREAALAETVTLTLIEQVRHYLRLARHDPKLRFESS
jgi:tetratricopeptide (TPR) repeat protein